MALAENSGVQPIETLSAVKSQQIKVIYIISSKNKFWVLSPCIHVVAAFYNGSNCASLVCLNKNWAIFLIRRTTPVVGSIATMLAQTTCVSKMSLRL